MRKKKFKKLTSNTLRGLYVDLIEGSEKGGYYKFDKYEIRVVDIEHTPQSNTQRVLAWRAIPKNREKDVQYKRHIYKIRKLKGECIKCGNIKLAINKFGKKSVLCEQCLNGHRKSRMKMKKRRKNENVSVQGGSN